MKFLKGKTADEIYEEFRNKHDIGYKEWEHMRKFIRRPKLGKHFVLVWGCFVIIIGICMTIALWASLEKGEFHLLYTPAVGVFQRFLNIFWAFFLFVITLLMVILPWVRFAQVYDWEL